jgi:tetratricopeptide (TPR) repeat protein
MDQSPQMSLMAGYTQWLEETVQSTLKGKIRSREQVGQMLLQAVSPGTGELFERCLQQRLQASQTQLESLSDELKLAKANRIQRALQTIQAEWEHLQVQFQEQAALSQAIAAIAEGEASQKFALFLEWIDPNHAQSLNPEQLRQMAKQFTLLAKSTPTSGPESGPQPEPQLTLQQLAAGIEAGLENWHRLEGQLLSWIYDRSQPVGFSGMPAGSGPWEFWRQQVEGEWLKSLFGALSLGKSVSEIVRQRREFSWADWAELVVVMQYLQRGLVAWADQMIYDGKLSAKLSISVFLGFAVIWSQLAQGCQQHPLWAKQRQSLADSCFQVTIQIFRTFTQRPYFPLYGGIYAVFGGRYLREAIEYFDQPLRQVNSENLQSKGRILTLLGYSLRAQGRYAQAIQFHQSALEIAQTEGDPPAEIANFNHLSRIALAQKNYGAAIDAAQRALILSRQSGDSLGEANALANLGFSQVFQAKAEGNSDPENLSETYTAAIARLQRGRDLSEKTGDRQSQALCLSSLGIAYAVLEQPAVALPHLSAGWQAAQQSGDLYLQGLNLFYLSQSHYQLQHWESAILPGCLGMYLLDQVGAQEWRAAAGLMAILRGQIGDQGFRAQLSQERDQILAVIGVDGFDHIFVLLGNYPQPLEE